MIEDISLGVVAFAAFTYTIFVYVIGRAMGIAYQKKRDTFLKAYKDRTEKWASSFDRLQDSED
tara:strand:- start:11366 stop:11554 length:189 start_codon:yes stop_codon:yes gene_type:complete